MAHKVGDTVTVTRGPHKGDAHKVIHVHKDGRVNVKPHNKMPHQIKYRHGAATAKADEVKKMNEAKDHVSSNHAMHSHENEAQKKAHAAHMKKKHGVKTTYHGDDEVRYHGPKKNVKKALGNHYGGDHDHAKEEHPHIYKESTLKSFMEISRSMTPMRDKFGKSKAEKEKEAEKDEGTIITPKGFKLKDNDKEKLQKIQKMLKRDKAVAKKSTHPGPNENKGPCWDTHKQVGTKISSRTGKRVPNCVPKNENQNAALQKKLAKSAQSSEKGKKAVTLKKAPFRIPSEKDMMKTDEGAMKRIATSQSSKPDRMAPGKGLDTFKKKPPEKNEVLDSDKARKRYMDKARYSKDRANNSAAANMVRKTSPYKDLKTVQKRDKGMAAARRKAIMKFREM